MRYNPRGIPKLEQATTADKILVLIRTKEERQPEITRQEGGAKQGVMGARMVKQEGLLTPVELVIRHHPDHIKQIRHCMNKWHKRTSGILQWPEKGTFDVACSKEVEANIKHYKSKDTSNSREGKRARE